MPWRFSGAYKGVPDHPCDGHQRENQHGAHDRVAAARPRPAHRPLLLAAPDIGHRTHRDRRRLGGRRDVRADLARDRPVPADRRRRAHGQGREPADLLRGDHHPGLRGLRRRPGGRGDHRGRPGRHHRRHERRRRPGLRGDPDLAGPHGPAGGYHRADRRGEGGHHQARRLPHLRGTAGRRRAGAAGPRPRTSRSPTGSRASNSASRTASIAVGGQQLDLQGLAGATRASCCRCTANTRRRTPRWRWPPWRRSSGEARRS